MNETEKHPSYLEEDEITLKELILKLKEFWNVLWQLKFMIILIALIFGGLFGLKSYLKETVYTSKLTFMLNQDEGGSMGGLSSLMGSFGLGGGSSSDLNLEKMMELMRSRRIIQGALFDSLTIDGESDIAANHIIKILDLHEKWKKNEYGLPNFLFLNSDPSKFSRVDNLAMKILHSKVVGTPKDRSEALLSSEINDDTGIVSLSFSSPNEELSIWFLNNIFKNLSEFYISKSIEKQKYTYNNLKERSDSVSYELKKSQYALANFQDSHRGVFTKKDQVSRYQLEGKVQELLTIYKETVKNKEFAAFSLKDRTPVVQPIDLPISPIKPDENSLIKSLIIGGFLGGFLASLYFIFRKIFRDAMSQN